MPMSEKKQTIHEKFPWLKKIAQKNKLEKKTQLKKFIQEAKKKIPKGYELIWPSLRKKKAPTIRKSDYLGAVIETGEMKKIDFYSVPTIVSEYHIFKLSINRIKFQHTDHPPLLARKSVPRKKKKS